MTKKTDRLLVVTGGFLVLEVCLLSGCAHSPVKQHQHCMKIAGMIFLEYADEHKGMFPCHTNGSGDALLLLVKDRPQDIPLICGPGDDGQVFSNALTHGFHVPESQCSRVYVQGLSRTNDPQLCILFDRRSVPAGDHFYGSGKRVREACMIDGSMEVVPDKGWTEFSRRQVELLVAAGFKREKALEYYPGRRDSIPPR